MELSLATDFASDTGSPQNALRLIAEAGFTYVHWCHQWNTDFLYSQSEIRQIADWLKEYGLKLLDLHGSLGKEKNWGSFREYERLAGVELVLNRIEMTASLGGRAVVMHLPAEGASDQVRRSLDALKPVCEKRKIRIALENGRFSDIRKLLAEYSPEFLGLCFDSGHCFVDEGGFAFLEQLKSRLIAVHLHDNDGKTDQHKPVFSGSIPWKELALILAQSAYHGCLNLEVSIRNSGFTQENLFLNHLLDTGKQLTLMVQKSARPRTQLLS